MNVEQITLMCQRLLGENIQVVTVHKLSGGTFNQVYRLELANGTRAVLRIAPSANAKIEENDDALMRREYNIQPFFAALGPLLPRILGADFTQHLFAQDYMLQAYCEGERWEDIEEKLTDAENLSLWQQFGAITQRIHTTTGELFGWPAPGKQFKTWHELLSARFAKLAEELEGQGLPATDLLSVLNLVRDHPNLLAEVTKPHLLHGDLWLFNLLVQRNMPTPQIAAVLDADRAWWGDPLADWTIFLLTIRRHDPEWAKPLQAFQIGYGPIWPDGNAEIRQNIYTAMHLGGIILWSFRKQNQKDVARACNELKEVAEALLHQVSIGQATSA